MSLMIIDLVYRYPGRPQSTYGARPLGLGVRALGIGCHILKAVDEADQHDDRLAAD